MGHFKISMMETTKYGPRFYGGLMLGYVGLAVCTHQLHGGGTSMYALTMCRPLTVGISPMEVHSCKICIYIKVSMYARCPQVLRVREKGYGQGAAL